MSSAAVKVREVLARHPGPWTYSTFGGQVIVTDAAGGNVQLFDMLDFSCAFSQLAAQPKQEPSPAPDPAAAPA